MIRKARLAASVLFALFCLAAAAQPINPGPEIPIPPAQPGSETTPFDPAKAMPRPLVRDVYRAELGPLYKDSLDEKLYGTHLLIEKYFSTPASKDRAEIVKEIERTEVDPNVLGRLTRIRLGWPDLKPGGIYYVNEKVGVYQLRYFFGVPERYTRATAWPLVIKLPTAHAFVANPPPSAEQVTKIYQQWIEEELTRHPDACVMMPLLHLAELYGPSYIGMNNVLGPMRHVCDRANIDPARVYLIGHSMSGHAAWNLALHYPTYFASFNVLAGSATGDWQRTRLIGLRNVLPVVWHDAKDDVVKVDRARSIVRALRTQKLDVQYTETSGLKHTPSPDVAEQLYQKTVARVRELYPAEVMLQSNRPDTIFNRNDWVQVWQPLTPGKEQKMFFRHGRGFMRVNANAHTLSAARTAKNRIEASARNIATLRFYVNDQTIDFSQPVTVIVNKKPRFEGNLTPNVGEMLKDQLFLGRGLRYYTAVIDIDLVPPSAKPAPTTKPSP